MGRLCLNLPKAPRPKHPPRSSSANLEALKPLILHTSPSSPEHKSQSRSSRVFRLLGVGAAGFRFGFKIPGKGVSRRLYGFQRNCLRGILPSSRMRLCKLNPEKAAPANHSAWPMWPRHEDPLFAEMQPRPQKLKPQILSQVDQKLGDMKALVDKTLQDLPTCRC